MAKRKMPETRNGAYFSSQIETFYTRLIDSFHVTSRIQLITVPMHQHNKATVNIYNSHTHTVKMNICVFVAAFAI